MDWHSRSVLAWRLSNTMDTEFCVAALEEAVDRYGVPEIFNTDQGSQFTSLEFIQGPKDAGVVISRMAKVAGWITRDDRTYLAVSQMGLPLFAENGNRQLSR